MAKHIHQKIERSPEEQARLKELRERYQREKPSIADLEAKGAEFAPLGEVILLRGLARELKQERERQGLSLTELAAKLGMDVAMLSRIETGTAGNPTIGTLSRVAHALGKDVACRLVEQEGTVGS